MDAVSKRQERSQYEYTHSFSLSTDCQLDGKLTDGMGHAGHMTASSPGDVPFGPVLSYDWPPRLSIRRWRHILSARRNSLYRSFLNVSLLESKINKAKKTYINIRSASRIRQRFDANVVIIEGEFGLKTEKLRSFEKDKRACSLRVQARGRKQPTSEELLDAGPVFSDLGAAAEHEVHNMNPICMEDGEGSGTALGVCAWEGGVVTELEEVTGLSKR